MRPFGVFRRRWKVNCTTGLKEKGCQHVECSSGTGQTSVELSFGTIMDCIHLALGRVQLGAFEQGSGLHSTGTGKTSVELSFGTIMDCIHLALGRVQLGAFEQGSGLHSTGTEQTSVELSFSTIMDCIHLALAIGDRGGTVVKVLCYKPEGRWFDSRWCHWNFSLT